jgi:aspartyl-tRNA(Asn)/glutamyl-tRNA(Gln) amidotransferase subunit A
MHTLNELSAALEQGRTTSRQLVEDCLARIAEPGGEGARAFVKVHADAARAMADATDALRRANRHAGPMAGIPVSVKDLFDIAGEPTPAGSKVLAGAKPAQATAPCVQRVMQAGFIPVGRTNMTEFAFSGLGINPHYGTPRSPWDRATGRIPGGSSSGAAVSVADGMAYAALGTDTGGSCRVPAAMCGITGYKPTARRVSIAGVLPLAPSLDSVGPLANSVACCATVDAVLAGEAPAALRPLSLAGLRLAVPQNYVLDGMDATVAAAFERALSALSQAGAQLHRVTFAAFDALVEANRNGGLAAPEALAWHRDLLAAQGDLYDPRIRTRIMGGASMTAAQYFTLVQARAAIIRQFDVETCGYDAVVLPTCPLIPPEIAALERDEAEYGRVNLLQLRNTAAGNFLDRCAISLPCHRESEAPVGLMVMGETMGDERLFSVAAAIETALKGLRAG